MRKRCTAAIIALLSLAVAAPLASAVPTTHQLDLKIQDSTITSQGDRPGNDQTTAGLVSGSPFGQGVESISDKVTKATKTTFTFQGKITIYTTHGTVTGTIEIKVTPASNGSASGAGGGKFTAGTGRYRGAHGMFSFTGAEAANSSVFISHTTGSVSY